MSNYLFLLFLLACPLMMVFMMRGMRSGDDKGAENKGTGRESAAIPANPDANQRIIDLERQVADLRSERDHSGGPARRT